MSEKIPTVAIVYRNAGRLGFRWDDLLPALQEYVDRHLAPVWNCPARIEATTKPTRGDWVLELLARSDVDDALGYHDRTAAGLPYSRAFVQSSLEDGTLPTEDLSHELAEMLVDPSASECVWHERRKLFYAKEISDAVQGTPFLVGGLWMANFVYPEWFGVPIGGRPCGAAVKRFDHNRACRRPEQILKTGYMPIYRRGRWTSIFGSRHSREVSLRAARRIGRTS